MTDVVMPRMGETVDEGTVNEWFKQVGDQVTEGEPLLEIGTDKVDTEIPAPVTGVLSRDPRRSRARPSRSPRSSPSSRDPPYHPDHLI